MMFFARHCPSRRHCSFFLQLQSLTFSAAGYVIWGDCLIMWCDGGSHARHTRVAEFWSVSNEDIVKGMFLWKTLVDDAEGFSSQVIILIIHFCLYLAQRRSKMLIPGRVYKGFDMYRSFVKCHISVVIFCHTKQICSIKRMNIFWGLTCIQWIYIYIEERHKAKISCRYSFSHRLVIFRHINTYKQRWHLN